MALGLSWVQSPRFACGGAEQGPGCSHPAAGRAVPQVPLGCSSPLHPMCLKLGAKADGHSARHSPCPAPHSPNSLGNPARNSGWTWEQHRRNRLASMPGLRDALPPQLVRALLKRGSHPWEVALSGRIPELSSTADDGNLLVGSQTHSRQGHVWHFNPFCATEQPHPGSEALNLGSGCRSCSSSSRRGWQEQGRLQWGQSHDCCPHVMDGLQSSGRLWGAEAAVEPASRGRASRCGCVRLSTGQLLAPGGWSRARRLAVPVGGMWEGAVRCWGPAEILGMAEHSRGSTI